MRVNQAPAGRPPLDFTRERRYRARYSNLAPFR